MTWGVFSGVNFAAFASLEAMKRCLKLVALGGVTAVLLAYVSGTASAAPVLAVEYPATYPLPSSGARLAFGNVEVASYSTQYAQVTLRNRGTTTLSGLAVTVDGAQASAFTVEALAVTSLAPGKSTTMLVLCHVAQVGAKVAALHITSNDTARSPFDIALSATGVIVGYPPSSSPYFKVEHSFQRMITMEGLDLKCMLKFDRLTEGPGSVVLSVVPGSAGAKDVTTPVVQQTIAIPAGVNNLDVPLGIIIRDKIVEPTEYLSLTLTDPEGLAVLNSHNKLIFDVAVLDADDSVRPTISVSEKAGVFTVSASDNTRVDSILVSSNGQGFSEIYSDGDWPGTKQVTPLKVDYSGEMRPGRNVFAFKCRDAVGNESAVVTRVVEWKVASPLVVDQTGNGTLTRPFPGTDETKLLTYTYTIKAVPATGYVFDHWDVTDFGTSDGITPAMQELPSLTFVHQEGLHLTANFVPNPFVPEAIGKFNGLAMPSASVPAAGTKPTNETVGGFIATVTNTGSFTGTLKMDGLSLSMNGVFDNTGVARFGKDRAKQVPLPRPGKPPLEVSLGLDLSGFSGITGAVVIRSRTGDIVAQSDISADRVAYSSAIKAPESISGTTGKIYTLVFGHQDPPSGWTTKDVPQGDGYATGRIKTDGSVSFSGRLADHTAVSMSTALSASNTWPWFSQLYSLGGSFAALATMDTSSDNAEIAATGVHWFRPWQNVQWYPWGWADGIAVDMMGAVYAPPALLDLQPVDMINGNATLQWSDGLLTSAITKNLNLHPTTSIVTHAPARDTSFTMSLTAATGLMSGTFTHTNATKPAWQGVLVQRGALRGGYGYFMTTAPKVMDGMGESGGVRLLAK